MNQRITSAFFRRKALFLLGCILLLIAVAHRPWVLLTMFSAKRLTNTVVLVVAGDGLLVGLDHHRVVASPRSSLSGEWSLYLKTSPPIRAGRRYRAYRGVGFRAARHGDDLSLLEP